METIPNKEIKLIERFFEYDLNDVELKAFKEALKSDASFRKKVEEYESALDRVTDIYYPKVSDRKEQLKKEWMNDIKNTQKEATIKPLYRKILWAAMAASILFGLFFLFQGIQKTSPDQLADNYWNATYESSTNNVRGNTPEEEKTFSDAILACENKDFEKVKQYLDNIPDKNAEQLYFKATYEYQSEQYTAATQSFQNVIDNHMELRDKAYWFQALAFLKIGDLVKAKNNLTIIIKQKYPKHKEAAQLLEAL